MRKSETNHFHLIENPAIPDPSMPIARALGWNLGNILISPATIAFCNIHSIRPEPSIISSVIIGACLAQKASNIIDQNKDYFQLIPNSPRSTP